MSSPSLLTVAEAEKLADRLIDLRSRTSPAEDREALLTAANVLRKAAPAMAMIDAVMRHVRETLPPSQVKVLESVAQDALDRKLGEG